MEPPRLHLAEDRWLSRLIQRDAYNVLFDPKTCRRGHERENDQAGLQDFERLLMRGAEPVFGTAKVRTTDLAACHFLEAHGFRLVDTNVTFWKPVSTEPQPSGNDNLHFRRAEPSDREAVVDIARRSFRFSRFHLDPAISSELANEIKAAWAENYFHQRRGDKMVVAVEQGIVIGFALLLARPKPAFTIDLIAVASEFQRRGAAAGMIQLAENVYREPWPVWGPSRYVMVGTQLANRPSIAFYEKLGFSVFDSQYVFHYHNPPEYETK